MKLEKRICGIDESGRGPVVGPMVIVGVMFKEGAVEKLKEIGVKDSKQLSPAKREELFNKIMKLAEKVKIVEVWPEEIDQRFAVGINLNQLEAAKFAEIINELKPNKAIIDTPEVNTEKFANYLRKFLNCKVKLICENFADKNHPEVSAASIIAKVTRDKRIREIEEKIGIKIGIGYPSDPVTLKFVEKALKKPEWLRKYVRKTWLTFQRIKEEKEQTKLGSFL